MSASKEATYQAPFSRSAITHLLNKAMESAPTEEHLVVRVRPLGSRFRTNWQPLRLVASRIKVIPGDHYGDLREVEPLIWVNDQDQCVVRRRGKFREVTLEWIFASQSQRSLDVLGLSLLGYTEEAIALQREDKDDDLRRFIEDL